MIQHSHQFTSTEPEVETAWAAKPATPVFSVALISVWI